MQLHDYGLTILCTKICQNGPGPFPPITVGKKLPAHFGHIIAAFAVARFRTKTPI